jgi:hypothetical protein
MELPKPDPGLADEWFFPALCRDYDILQPQKSPKNEKSKIVHFSLQFEN